MLVLVKILIVAFTLFLCSFLSLIAKYYRQKSGTGPRAVYFFAFTGIFSAGHFLRIPPFEKLVGQSISSVCLIAGGAGLLLSAGFLYKSMMTVKKQA